MLLAAAVATFVGFLIWLRWSLSYFFLVDRGDGVLDSLRESARFMQGNKLTTFLLMIVVGFLGLVFTLVTCCCGQVLYLPFLTLLIGMIYLTATGQFQEG